MRIPVRTWLVALAIWAGALLRSTAGGGSATTLVKGQLAPASILAEVDFDAEDPRRTQLARDAAAASVAPVFRVIRD
ncbi:MAG: hypothetical protein U1G05_03330 [Kiritimatiellia bacterium]